MAYSNVIYTGTGVQTNFSVPFPYLNKSHVYVYVNGVQASFTWNSSSIVTVSPAPALGATVVIQRSTPATQMVSFTDGSTVSGGDLNTANLQTIYISQEAIDAVATKIGFSTALGTFDFTGFRLSGVGAPVNSSDGANKAYVDTSVSTVNNALTSHIGTGGAAHAAATQSVAGFLSATDKAKLDNLSLVAISGQYADLGNKPTLGGAAALNVGTTAGSVAAGNDSRLTGALQTSALGAGVFTALANSLNGSSGLLGVAQAGSIFSPPILSNIAALTSFVVPASINTVQLNGYAAAGDRGAALYTRVSTPTTVMPWHHQSADGAWWQLTTMAVTPFHFGAKGDNSTDDTAPFQYAVNYAQAFSVKAYILRASYVLSRPLTISIPIDVDCDPSANMRWTNAAASALPTISSIVASGQTATVTFASAHGMLVGQSFTLSGVTPAAYNTTFTVLTVPSTTTLTIAVASGTANASVVGAGVIPVIGVLIDLRAATSNFGLNTVKLPNIFPAGVNSAFQYQNYPSAWTASGRVGSGIVMWGGSRMNVTLNAGGAWIDTILIQATYDAMNGARAPQNINVEINTSDLSEKAIHIDSGPSGAGGIGPITVTANTIFAKFPVYFDSTVNNNGQNRIFITGQVFVNEAGGCVVYENGNKTNTSVVVIQWAMAGYSSYDSPTGTATTMTAPFVGGSNSSNGTSTDGNAAVGYFGGYGNTIRVGFALDQTGQKGGALPASGIVTRVRNVGLFNDISVENFPLNAPAISTTATQGEANFNGGVGGALVNKIANLSIVVPTLAAGASTTLYFYHSLLSAGLQTPLQIIPLDGTMVNSGLTFAATDYSGVTNREVRITVKNPTASSVTGASYPAFVKTGN